MPAPFETPIVCPVLIGREPQLDLLARLVARAGQSQTARPIQCAHNQALIVDGWWTADS